MYYTDRTEFTYDPALNARQDVAVALRMFDEYCRVYGPKPPPRFFEVDRSVGNLDEVWHVPKSPRTQFTRQLDVAAINQFLKPDWRLTKLGITQQRRDLFWISNLQLQLLNYFPLRGDLVYWNGIRYSILNVNIPPETYWGQTGVWTGLTAECIVPAAGDALPALPLSSIQPAEQSSSVTPG